MKHYIFNEKGVLLAPVLGIVTILLSLGLSYLRLSRDNITILQNDDRGQEAFYIMEAGIEDGIHSLLQNPSWRSGFQNKTFHTGNYTVIAQTVGSTLELKSIGTVSNSRAQSTATAIITINTGAFKYAIQVGGNINMNGGSGTVNGDVAGDQINIPKIHVEGTISNESTDQVPLPDWSAWRAAATTYINGNYTFSGSYSGIWYVDGNVTINSSTSISGTIISTGSISMNNKSSISIMSGSNNVALISKINIEANNSSSLSINGLVYAGNNIMFNSQASTSLNGSIVAGGNLDYNNATSISIIYDSSFLTDIPSFFSDPDGTGLKVTAWK